MNTINNLTKREGSRYKSYMEASISDGENVKNLTKIMIDGLFLRDTFSQPPCTLIQPSMGALADDFQQQIPEFAKNFCPPIYPLGYQHWQARKDTPFMSFHSLQVNPSPGPPLFASQAVIDCQPLMIHVQEESCLRISSFLADGIVVGPGSVLPDSSVSSFMLTLQALDLTVPLDAGRLKDHGYSNNSAFPNLFSRAMLHIENLFMFESPSLRLGLLHLENDPACFCLWDDQPIDAGLKKWSAGASYFSLSLETSNDANGPQNSSDRILGSWKCAEIRETCIQVAMATPDGSPLVCIPPPGGIVRVGMACEQYLSNASVEQLFFVLDLYAYFGEVGEKIMRVGKNSTSAIHKSESWSDNIMSKVPSDAAVSFAVKHLQLRFLEDSCKDIQGNPLVQFIGNDLFTKVGHRTLGGAIAISSTMRWDSVEVDCVDAEQNADGNGALLGSCRDGSFLTANGCPELRAVLWIQHKGKKRSSASRSDIPFLAVNIDHVIPSQVQHASCHSLNVSACIAGVRLGGGMNYTEALLHRFGILGPDGGPSEGLLKGLENLSAGPLSKFLKPSHLAMDNMKSNGNCEDRDSFLSHLGMPDDVDVSVDLRNWLFALEGAQEMTGNLWFDNHVDGDREQLSWHTSFKSLKIKAKNSSKDLQSGCIKSHIAHKYPVELITIGVEGLQTLKPQVQQSIRQADLTTNGVREADMKEGGGVNLEVHLVVSEDNFDDALGNWMVENLKFSVEQPIEAVVTKNELQHLASLCKSEIDSMGRVTVGILRLLKLDGTIGQAAIDQLSNLGTEGMYKIFSPRELSRGGSGISFDHNISPHGTSESPHSSVRTVVASLEKEVEDAESKCAALITNFGKSEPSCQHIDHIKDLGRQIESIRSLLKQLKAHD